MKYSYAIRRFSLDGNSIVDHRANSIEEAWKLCEDAGSQWYFYPVCVAIREGSHKRRGRVVDAPEMLTHYKGRRCETLQKSLERAAREIGNTTITLDDFLTMI